MVFNRKKKPGDDILIPPADIKPGQENVIGSTGTVTDTDTGTERDGRSRFRSWDGTYQEGYYGQDETGDSGYYADPEHTTKLANGNWGKEPSKVSSLYGAIGTDMSRNEALAGKTVYDGRGNNVTYDENGYAVRADNLDNIRHSDTLRGVSKDAVLNADSQKRLSMGGSPYDQLFFTDYELGQAAQWRKEAEQGLISWETANQYVESIRAKYGYSGGTDGSGYYKVERKNDVPPEYKAQNDPVPTTPGIDYMTPTDTTTVPTGTPGTTPSGTPGTMTETSYESSYSDLISALVKTLLNVQPYQDDTQFPEYQNQYADEIATVLQQLQNVGQFTAPEYQNQYANDIAAVLQKLTNLQPFEDTTERPVYDDKYAPIIEQLSQQILSRDPFSYDPENDPLYQSYADMYSRNGRRAMEDTIGQLSARTGGMASSWAGMQAQQSYNNYMEQLNDVIPQLYQLAYSMYQNEGNEQRNNLNMMLGLDQNDYGKYLDSMGQYNTDRNFALSQYQNGINNMLSQLGALQSAEQSDYGKYSDQWQRDYSVYQNNIANMLNQLGAFQSVEQGEYAKFLDSLAQANKDRSFSYEQYRDSITDLLNNLGVVQGLDQQEYARRMNDRDFAYNQWRDTISDARYMDETAYNRALTENSLAQSLDEETYNRLMQAAQLAAGYGDYSLLNALGIDTSAYEAQAGAYTPTFSVSQLQKEIDYARKNGTSLSPTAQRDYEYYYGEPYGGGYSANIGNGNGSNTGSNSNGTQDTGKGNGSTNTTTTYPAPSRDSVDYSPDEGVIRWNGNSYSSVDSFASAISSLSKEQQDKLWNSLGIWGIRKPGGTTTGSTTGTQYQGTNALSPGRNGSPSTARTRKITNVNQLGSEAMAIATAMSKSNSASNLSSLADRIARGIENGSITEYEADFLLSAMGF